LGFGEFFKRKYRDFLILATFTNFLVMIGFTVTLVILPKQVLYVLPGYGYEVTTALYVYISAGFFLFVLFPLLVKEFGWRREYP
jgi:hypothetical protein